MPRRRTRGEAHIEALLSNLDPGSERYRVLRAARDFKASWVELGERLTETREHEQFKQWGYTSFEAYCRQELRLKAETANKLTRSFAFLRDHNPDSLETREVKELPPLDVVDLLSRARERAKVTDKQFSDIQGEVFEGEAPPTRAEVLKRFREVDPEAFKPAAPRPTRTGGGGGEELRKALLLGERLLELVSSHDGVSRESRRALEGVVAELKSLFEDSRKTA
jgi:hypothetical protein